MKRFVAFLVIIASAGAVGRTQRAPAFRPDALSKFFKPGIVFQDRNNDGVVDFVNARIVLADHPSSGEIAAAADIAARLGFETSAMNLPLRLARPEPVDGRARSGPTEQPTIFVGAKSLAGSGLTAESLGGAALKVREGVVTAFSTASISAADPIRVPPTTPSSTGTRNFAAPSGAT